MLASQACSSVWGVSGWADGDSGFGEDVAGCCEVSDWVRPNNEIARQRLITIFLFTRFSF
jgi:hypothetical protein